jgi:hypothetical protein
VAIVALAGAVGWALLIGLLFSLVPVERTESSSGASDGRVASPVTTASSTLLEAEGPSVLIVLALPVVPATVALARRRRSVSLVAGWVTAVFCLLGAMSVGLFYLPVVALLFVAAARQRASAPLTDQQRRRRAVGFLRSAFTLAVLAASALAVLPLRHLSVFGTTIVLAVLVVPVALTALALHRPRRSTSLAIGWFLVVGGTLLATLLGLYFIPSGVLLLLAARWQRVPDQEPEAASRQCAA